MKKNFHLLKKRDIYLLTIRIISLLIIMFLILFFIFFNNNKLNSLELKTYEGTIFFHDGIFVNVNFLGEFTNEEIFGSKKITDLVHPVDQFGIKQGVIYNSKPNWLKFEYSLNDFKKTIFIAKEPVMNFVSYDDILRVGAVLGDDSKIFIGYDNSYYLQDSIITDINENKYRVRLIDCGNSTTNPLSEWNFLIGGIHEGDIDFKNLNDQKIYSFIKKPYSDNELKVGFNGSLSWCKNKHIPIEDYVVSRGYFYVSRFHASESYLRTDRLYWRPVLELIDEVSSEKMVLKKSKFLGKINNSDLFGDKKFSDLIGLKKGFDIDDGKPFWLKFQIENKTLIISQKPIKYGLSYNDLLFEGLVSGTEKFITVLNNSTYALRLIKCGDNTLDHNSEWNLLIGGVSKGDEDFSKDNYPFIYSVIDEPFDDIDLNIGVGLKGTSTWCQETKEINNKIYAVNRGHLTVSRYHLTETSFLGYGFSYRPVLELIK